MRFPETNQRASYSVWRREKQHISLQIVIIAERGEKNALLQLRALPVCSFAPVCVTSYIWINIVPANWRIRKHTLGFPAAWHFAEPREEARNISPLAAAACCWEKRVHALSVSVELSGNLPKGRTFPPSCRASIRGREDCNGVSALFFFKFSPRSKSDGW